MDLNKPISEDYSEVAVEISRSIDAACGYALLTVLIGGLILYYLGRYLIAIGVL